MFARLNRIKKFFFVTSLVSSLFLIPDSRAEDSKALPQNLPRDGVVRFYVYHLDEFVEIRYAEVNGNWTSDAESKLKKIFRSRGDDQTFVLDRRLIELADHLQDKFQADEIEVISAYRSPEFNRELKENGRNVANESFHTKGLAMDVHLDEINEATLRDYLLSLKLGGVGYYGNKLMVHMDFGPVRQWTDGGFAQNTEIGLFNKANSLKIRTDLLYYRLNSTLNLSILAGLKDVSLEFFRSGVLQKFSRGKWIDVVKGGDFSLAIEGDTVKFKLAKPNLPENAYGKFRFRFLSAQGWQNSNEFYVKRL